MKVAFFSAKSYDRQSFTVGLILTLDRKLHKAYNRVRDDNFSLEAFHEQRLLVM